MTSLSFLDVNVWLALAAPEHVHSEVARRWWDQAEETIAFCRLTQLGFLRVVTTAAAMGGKPLSISQAWVVYDRFFDDDRVTFEPEAAAVDSRFRERAVGRAASPNTWVDAWLFAVAQAAGGRLVTFDKALAARGALCLLPPRS